MSGQRSTGVPLMREHEAACERETREREPMLAALLEDASDCIIASAHAFDGLVNLEDDEQAVLTQVLLGARTAGVFLALTLAGQYESALAVTRTLIEDGVACAYLAEFPTDAQRWRRAEFAAQYGDMARKVINAHAERGEDEGPAEAAAWRRIGDVLRATHTRLNDVSHANPARMVFVRKAHGYELYPFFDREIFRAASWFGLVGMAQLVSFPRKRLVLRGKVVPACNSDALHERISAALDEIERTDDPLGLHGNPA